MPGETRADGREGGICRHPQVQNLCEQGDCGFGREVLSRRIAYRKRVSLVLGTNIVPRELDPPEAHIRVADPKLYFANVGEAG